MGLSLLSELPWDLSGQSLLDVGCGAGAVAREAAARGATVVAIDLDEEVLDLARATSDCHIDYQLGDLEVDLPNQRFDHVVCHNLLHKTRHPIAVIDRLSDASEISLTLDVTGPDSDRPSRLLRRDYGVLGEFNNRLQLLPVTVIGRHGTPTRKREQKFFFSESALRNLLIEQRRCFASLTTRSSDESGRYVATAFKRRVQNLLVITGLTGSGKSTFIDALSSGDKEVAQIVGHAATSWSVTNSSGLQKLDAEVEYLLFHYDLLRPWRRDAGVHARDEGLEVLRTAQRAEVVVLITKRTELRSRLQRELATVTDRDSRQALRLREVIELYDKPERTAARVQAFLEHCQHLNLPVRFVEATNRYQPIEPSSWRSVLEG